VLTNRLETCRRTAMTWQAKAPSNVTMIMHAIFQAGGTRFVVSQTSLGGSAAISFVERAETAPPGDVKHCVWKGLLDVRLISGFFHAGPLISDLGLLTSDL
jgi:hypothetical protein